VNGAEDPISGLIAVMEEARAMGELVKAGWKPKRTIIFLRVGCGRTGPDWLNGICRRTC